MGVTDFDTKVAVVVRDGRRRVAAAQRLARFLMKRRGRAARAEPVVGPDYEDASGRAYLPLFSGVVIAQRSFDAAFSQGSNELALVDMKGGATAGATADLKRAIADFTDARVETQAAFVKRIGEDVNTSLALFYVLLALSVIVSLFGMVNTMILSVYERTRELGMLRAIGMTRRQARRMIRHESVITALIGAALGLPLGVFLAAIATRGLADQGIGFHLPITALVVFTAIATIAGILAAIPPARRASKLNVLDALQYE